MGGGLLPALAQTMSDPAVACIGPGVYRVTVNGRVVSVYVAGPPGRRWAFSNGRVYQEQPAADHVSARASTRALGPQLLSAPMPATVIKVFATAGAAVTRGDTLIVLEAMKMELPLRATADGVVTGVWCREGQMVTPDTILVEVA